MKIVYRLIFFVIFIIVLVIVIAYARGYRFNIKEKSFSSNGIIAITSYPKTAKVYINDEFKGITDINLTLPPGKYKVEVKKEGYLSWEKTISLKGELVVNLDPTLFPTNPSLSPLTNIGVIKALPIDDSNKILILSDTGIYIFEAVKKPLSFPPLKLIAKKELFPEDFDFKKAEVFFSPDFKQVVVNNYLLSLDEENQFLFDLSVSEQSKNNLLAAWEEKKQKNNLKILETFPQDFEKIASDSFKIISFSPSNDKVLYQSQKNLTLPIIISPRLISTNQSQEKRELKKDYFYIYDRKEDRNYELGKDNFDFQWYTNSKNLFYQEERKISVIDYDNTNKKTVYSGPFEKEFLTISADGQLIVLANLNPEANPLPDLYLISIK